MIKKQLNIKKQSSVMKTSCGVYLESNFYSSSGKLYCQDIYSKVLDLLSKKTNIRFNYLIRTSNTNSNFNEIKYFNKIYYLEPYKSLVHLIPLYLFYIPFSIKSIKKFVEDSDTVLIMIPSPISKTIYKIAKQKNKKIVILVRQDIVEMTRNRFTGLKKNIAIFFANYYQNYFFRKINNKDIVITSGEKLKLEYLKITNYVYSFADSRFFNKDVINILHVKDVDLNKKLKFLFVARLEINKGIKELLNVALFYRDKITLTIVGDGAMSEKINSFIKKHKLFSTIKCLGFIDFGEALLKVYRSHDFFIFPSYSEGLPQVILEAMASGCLVMSSSVGSIPYVIKNNHNGILFKPNNQRSLNSCMKNLIDGIYDIKNLKKNSLLTANNYTFEKQIKILENSLN